MVKRKLKSVLYRDRRRPVETRVKDLLGRMTIQEKLRQMGYESSSRFAKNGKFSPQLAKKFLAGIGIGGLEDPRMEAKTGAQLLNRIQKFLMTNTRLGIPALVAAECLHGHMSPGATIFPQAIALGSSWDTTLLKKIATTIAREARAVGVSQALAPDLDLARDPRWGRVEETYGEDPYLVGRMGLAYIKGILAVIGGIC